MSRTSGKGVAKPPHYSKHLLLLGLLIAWVLPGTAEAQIHAARELYARAIGMANTDAESRAELLYAALKKAERSAGSKKERRELIAKIKQSLAELDPRSVDLIPVQDRAASKALKSATEYANAGWSRTAEEMLELALGLNPGLGEDEINALRAMLPSTNELLLTTFKDATMPYGGDVWSIAEAGIKSPAPQGRGQNSSAMLQSSRSFVGEYRLSLEVLGSTPSANYGIAFGIQGDALRYHLLNVINDGENSRLSFEAYKKGTFENLAVYPLALSTEEWADWVPISINVQRGRLAAVLGDSAPLIIETDATLDGAIGFFLAANHGNSKATAFRNLRVLKEN